MDTQHGEKHELQKPILYIIILTRSNPFYVADYTFYSVHKFVNLFSLKIRLENKTTDTLVSNANDTYGIFKKLLQRRMF